MKTEVSDRWEAREEIQDTVMFQACKKYLRFDLEFGNEKDWKMVQSISKEIGRIWKPFLI